MEFIINNVFDKFSFIIDFLLKQTIYTSILFVIIFIITFFLRRKSPQWHFGLWLLVLIRLILPTDLSLMISSRNFFNYIPLMNKVTASVENVTNKMEIDRIRDADLVNSNVLPVQGKTSTSAKVFKQRPDKYITWPALFAFLWITGCLLMIVLVLKKLLGYHRIIKNSSSIQDDKLSAFLLYWQHRLKIRRTVRIVSSDEFLSPFTIGVIRPVIYIPRTIINSADTDTIHSIIAHEMVHIKRFDALWIKLQNILQIIYFFNPIVWYANRQISLAREQICDSTVLIKDVISPRSYGNGMLHVLKLNLFGFDLADPLPGFGSHKKIFKHRIENIKKGHSMKKRKTVFILMVVCLIGFFVLPLASNNNYASAPQKKEYFTLNFKNADITEFLHLMSQLIEKNIIIDDKVKGKITITTVKKVPVSQAREIMRSILEVKGLAIVETPLLIKVVPVKEAIKKNIEIIIDGENQEIQVDEKVH